MLKTIPILLLMATTAAAHGWYPPSCCNGNAMSGDCAPIPSSAVKAVEGGYQITLAVGDHRLVTKHNTYFVPYERVKISQDDDYHACLWPVETKMQCFFAPPVSY